MNSAHAKTAPAHSPAGANGNTRSDTHRADRHAKAAPVVWPAAPNALRDSHSPCCLLLSILL